MMHRCIATDIVHSSYAAASRKNRHELFFFFFLFVFFCSFVRSFVRLEELGIYFTLAFVDTQSMVNDDENLAPHIVKVP